MTRRAVFPGSFDPLTIAHVAIVEAVVDQLDVDTVDLVISEVALAKEHRDVAPASVRAAAVRRVLRGVEHLSVEVTQAQLLVDIADGYDVLVIGADKWHQLRDATYYGGSDEARDAALVRLPTLAVAPRAGVELPTIDPSTSGGTHVLELDDHLHHVSSTGVRDGRLEWQADVRDDPGRTPAR